MDRRESIKSMLVGTLAGGTVISGCATPEPAEMPATAKNVAGIYGRTEKELIRDTQLLGEQFFNDNEFSTIATLCDLILPGTDGFKSASDAEVAEFIEFMAKDLPYHQTPIRGGIMWLDNFANESHGKIFNLLSAEQQTTLIDQIAYPNETKPELSQGAKFFTLMRNLTLTGFYTTKIGIDELGYKGNSPTVWDGVPEEVLKEHGLSYDEEWLSKCVDQEKRGELAQWDENGNLLT